MITTYQTLNQDFPKRHKKSKKVDDFIEGDRKLGALARNEWWRVILDEAQFIRNRCASLSIRASI